MDTLVTAGYAKQKGRQNVNMVIRFTAGYAKQKNRARKFLIPVGGIDPHSIYLMEFLLFYKTNSKFLNSKSINFQSTNLNASNMRSPEVEIVA